MTDDLQSEARKTARAQADEKFPGGRDVDHALRDGFVAGYLAHASIDDEPQPGTVLLCTRGAGSQDIAWRRLDVATGDQWEITGCVGLVSWAIILHEFPSRVALVPKS